MDLDSLLNSLIPSWISVGLLLSYFAYLAIAGSFLPGKIVPGVPLTDGTRLHYRCNGLLLLLVLVALLGVGIQMDVVSPTVIADRGLELLSTTFIFTIFVMFLLYIAGSRSTDRSSSLKPHVNGNFILDWWFGVQLNPQFMGIDLKFFFVRAGMMGWLLINLSVLAKSVQESDLTQSMILYQIFCAIYIFDYFFHEEFMTSTWDIIAERLGFMLVFGDLVWIPFTFSIQACDFKMLLFLSNIWFFICFLLSGTVRQSLFYKDGDLYTKSLVPNACTKIDVYSMYGWFRM